MSLTFHLIPHTHWDREWYLTRAGFRARLVPMMDDLLDRIEAGPRTFRFVLDGQAVILEDYLAIRPDRAPRVAAAVERGNLEIGPWYILADELIPAGESHLRNLLAGRSLCRRFGTEMPVLYSPDAFGHPADMARVAGEAGLRHGVLWRGAGPALGVDRDLFRWRHRSGTELLVHHLPQAGYEVGADLPGAGVELAARWKTLRHDLVRRAASSQIAVFVGADHHAVHPALADLAGRLQALEPHDAVRMSGLRELFAAIDSEAPVVPTVEGELRWSYGYTWAVQGVHGTRARQKRHHGRAELELTRVTEPLAALALAVRGLEQRPALTALWKDLLQSQFHDTIAGTASDAVAREQEVRLEGVRVMARESSCRSIEALTGHDPDRIRGVPDPGDPALVLFNPVPRLRDGVTVAELDLFRRDELVGPPGTRVPRSAPPFRSIVLATGSGERIPVQVLGSAPARHRTDARHHYPDQDVVDRVYVAFAAPRLPGYALAALRVLDEPSGPAAPDLRADAKGLGNGRVSVELAGGGTFHLIDHESGDRYRDLGGLLCEADRGDAYTVETDGVPLGRGRSGSWQVVAEGPFVAAARAGGRLDLGEHGAIRWRTTLVLYAGSPIVRVRLDIRNESSDCRLRLGVPTGIRARSLAGGPFGSVERDTVVVDRREYEAEYPVTTAPAHRFVALSDEHRGLAVLAPGFFEYDHRPGGGLAITLFRAVGELSRGDLAARPGHAAWPMATPEAQEHGAHSISLAFASVAGPLRSVPDRVERLWEDFALGCSSWWLGSAARLSEPIGEGLTLEGDGLIGSAVKPAEDGDGVILRAFNARGVETGGCWRLPVAGRGAERVRGDETRVERLPLDEEGRLVRFRAGPYDLVSIRVRFSAGRPPGEEKRASAIGRSGPAPLKG